MLKRFIAGLFILLVGAQVAVAGSSGKETTAKNAERLFNQANEIIAAEPAQGVELMRKAAEAGQIDAQFNMGLYYQQGKLVQQDISKAAYWFEKAGRRGYVNAQVNLGLLFEHVEGNFGEAANWYKMAADQGDPMGMHNLGALYACGWGVPLDLEKADDYLRQSEAAGFAQSTSMRHGIRRGAKCVQANPTYQ